MISTSGLHPTQVPLRSEAEAPGIGEELDRACRNVESLFINQLLSAMGRQSFGEGVLGGGVAHEVMEAQRNAALAEEMGRRGELGLARMLYEELLRSVENTNKGTDVDAAEVAASVGREET